MDDASTRQSDAPVALDAAIDEAAGWLKRQQRDDGHWLFDLEADATIPAEYILLNHYLGTPDPATEAKLGNYLRAIQENHGGWPLFHDGEFDVSATVKAYFALKLIGDDVAAPHMARARAAVLDAGGAARANVFTRFTLALFGQVPWRAVPVMRVEALLLPKWAAFHLDKVSYWSRTVMVPLLVLATLKPRARNPRGVDVRELFTLPAERERHYFTNPSGHWMGAVLLKLDRLARLLDPLMPGFLERRGLARARSFIEQRLNGDDGLGGIFPAMANALMAFDALGVPLEDERCRSQRRAIDGLLSFSGDGESGYCQPCLSPVWDTCLAAHAVQEAAGDDDADAARAHAWLAGRQITAVRGDWIANRGHVEPGGWAFQYWNDYYPDVDDTAAVVMTMDRGGAGQYAKALARARDWIVGMQSVNGGWGAFDADNEYYFLQHIPFADHGALLDPPSVDVTARCLGMLAQLGLGRDHQAVSRGLDFIHRHQEADGSWFGRWGTNYIYGTWSALCALNAAGDDMGSEAAGRAVNWLKNHQGIDGGWGEDCSTYWDERRGEAKQSTPSQTAWALLGLMAAGQVNSPEVARGIDYLLQAPREGGLWAEDYYNAVGFPRVFYLRYHGYASYFPLWALARYRNLKKANAPATRWGM